jgi:hypothetical protein
MKRQRNSGQVERLVMRNLQFLFLIYLQLNPHFNQKPRRLFWPAENLLRER